jgi:hypothetical protein
MPEDEEVGVGVDEGGAVAVDDGGAVAVEAGAVAVASADRLGVAVALAVADGVLAMREVAVADGVGVAVDAAVGVARPLASSSPPHPTQVETDNAARIRTANRCTRCRRNSPRFVSEPDDRCAGRGPSTELRTGFETAPEKRSLLSPDGILVDFRRFFRSP